MPYICRNFFPFYIIYYTVCSQFIYIVLCTIYFVRKYCKLMLVRAVFVAATNTIPFGIRLYPFCISYIICKSLCYTFPISIPHRASPQPGSSSSLEAFLFSTFAAPISMLRAFTIACPWHASKSRTALPGHTIIKPGDTLTQK